MRCGVGTRSPSTPPGGSECGAPGGCGDDGSAGTTSHRSGPARRAYQQDPADLARWRAEVYPAIAAQAKRRRAEIHWLDETGVRTDCTAGTSYSPRGVTPTARVNGRPARVNAVSTLTNAG